VEFKFILDPKITEEICGDNMNMHPASGGIIGINNNI
jgi:hypothetical protein